MTSAATLNTGQPAASPTSRIKPSALMVFALVAVAFLLRGSFLGNPDYHVDEEFYFLVAQRMWEGALPYVDIWDRKPIGLFLIYAALWPLRQSDMMAVQLAGLLFSVATALCIWRIARRWLNSLTASLPSFLYLFWLTVFGGANGQSPVFYNLFIASAALLVLDCTDRPAVDAVFRRKALLGMALAGIAIQVKYTAVVEGAFFGMWLLFLAWQSRMPLMRLVAYALLWSGVALGPTLLVILAYAAMGHLDAFMFANFQSIFLRARLEQNYLDHLIRFIVVAGMPLFLVAGGGALKVLLGLGCAGRLASRERLFLLGWATAAFGGFMSVGNFYDHYALPLLPPLLVLSAFTLESAIPATVFVALLSAWPTIWRLSTHVETTALSRSTIFGLAAVAKPYLKHGPMFIWDGPSFLYVAANAKPQSRFAYPDHLSNLVEQNALGIDTAAEMRRILSERPAVIITADKPLVPRWNTATWPIFSRALNDDYVEIARKPETWGFRCYILHVRRDLASPGTRRKMPCRHHKA